MKSNFAATKRVSTLQLVLALSILLPFTLVLAVVWVCQTLTPNASTKREEVNIFGLNADYSKKWAGEMQSTLASHFSSSMSA